MKSGAITSICVVCLLLVAFSGCAEEEILFVNDHAWEVIEGSDEEMLVPLVEAGARLGIEIEHRSTELLEFRWDFYRDVYSVERFPVVNGRIMADVLWLADLVGADVHRIGERTYIETVRPALTEIEAENDGVALRFNGFTPSTITIDDQGESVRIVLHHCTLEVDPQLILLPDGVVSRVRLSATPGGGEVLIQLRKPSSSGVRRQIEEDFFSLAVSFTADERRDTITRLGTGIALHEITLPQTHGLLRVDVLRVDDWRDNYRMRAVVPALGLDRPVPLAELARGSGADVAIDVSLWDVFKEPAEERFQGRSLLSYFTELDRGEVRMGIAGKIHTPLDARSCLKDGADFILLGRAAILHHDYPLQLIANPDFEPVKTPVSREYLHSQGLSEAFVTYMARWDGFVEDKH